MANISIRRTHNLNAEQAHDAVEEIAQRLGKEMRAAYRWEGDCLKFTCPGAEGRISLDPGQVEIALALSWLLSPAKGSIERSIHAYLDETLKTG